MMVLSDQEILRGALSPNPRPILSIFLMLLSLYESQARKIVLCCWSMYIVSLFQVIVCRHLNINLLGLYHRVYILHIFLVLHLLHKVQGEEWGGRGGGGKLTRRYTNDASKLTAAFVLSESQIYLSVAICFSLSPYCTVILCLQCSKFFLTPFRMRGEGVKAKMCPPTSFSHVISANVGISPQNFLTFSFNFFATLV